MKHILLLALLLPLAAEAKLNVVATLPDLAAIAREVGGDHVNVTCIGRPNEDPHYIQAKPSYILLLNKADLLIENGLELEIGWLPALLDQTRNPRIRAGGPGRVVAASGVSILEIPTQPVSRAMGDVHPGGNPHFTIDPERGKVVARNIAAALERLRPAQAAEFQANLQAFHQEVDVALAAAQQRLAQFRGAKVVTYHKSLSYLAERFGLQVINTVEPKPGVPPSAAHITALINHMQAEGVRLLLMEPWHERRTPELVAARAGAKVVTIQAQTGGQVTEYAKLLLAIAHQIEEALQ